MYPNNSDITTVSASESGAAGKSASPANLKDCEEAARQPNAVFVNVYDILKFNSWLWSVGIGVHHVGIQVYDAEYQFGRCDEGSGVRVVEPRHSSPHIFREQFYVGQTQLSALAVQELVSSFAQSDTWLGSRYHLVKHNCIHFAHAFCEALLPPNVRVAQMRTTLPSMYQCAYMEEVEVDAQRYSLPVLIPPHVDRLSNYAASYLPESVLQMLDSMDNSFIVP
ncbi:putative PPPDE putative peptidase domain containing protein [Leishmania utingensis]|uniref:PPPDE putative peptidase domain containing protein n=1 Tax=Leishmania utingensis TaxID=653362 RepID=A0AAW3AWV5_9TRYP